MNTKQLFRMIYVRAGKVRGRTFTSPGPYSAYEQAQRWEQVSQQWPVNDRMTLLTVDKTRERHAKAT